MTAGMSQARPLRPLTPVWEAIPDPLTCIHQWVNWRYALASGKWTKVPYQPDGSAASSTDPATWSSFEYVQIAYEGRAFDGVGYVLAADDPFVAFDFDHCVEDGRIIDPKVVGYVALLDSYTEITPSGTGLRVIVRGKLVGQDRKQGNYECYDDKRFVTITGRRYSK